MKKLYLILLGTMLAGMLTVGIVSLTDNDPTVTESGLVIPPKTDWSSVLSGAYTAAAETYYADTFPAREMLVSVNRRLNQFYYFSPMRDNTLVISHRGGAELGGERLPESEISLPQTSAEQAPPVEAVPPETPVEPTELPIVEPPEEEAPPEDIGEQPEQSASPDAVQQAGNVIVIGTRAMEVPYMSVPAVQSYGAAVSRIAAAMGESVRTFSLITPNGAQFYTPENMHSGNADQQKLITTAYASMSGVKTVDAYARICRHTDEYLFFRTDHHWTQLGAYYAYQAFCEAAGLTANELSAYQSGTYDRFVGSMYTFTSGYPQSQVLWDNPDSLTYYLPLHRTTARYYFSTELYGGVEIPVVNTAVQSGNKYLCYLSGDTPVCVIESDAPGGVCMVVKNSYGNAFVPFLTDHYSKVITIDPREFYGEGKPYIDLVQFAAEQGVNDLLVIDYPFMVSNAYYAAILNNLVK